MTLRIAHLTDYAWQDRHQTGQPVDFKPEQECEALYQSLREEQTDHLIVRGIGSRAAFDKLEQQLTGEDDVRRTLYLPGPDAYSGLAFFTTPSEPPTKDQESINLSDRSYDVKGRTYAPLAGGVYTSGFWIWNAVWPAPSENYERRRNEARLLTQALRPLIQAGEDVLVSLHSQENPDSPMFRMLEEVGLVQVIAADEQGDRWTHRDPEGVTYRQDQWIFATPALAARLEGRILDTPDLRLAGEYRHQLLTLAP